MTVAVDVVDDAGLMADQRAVKSVVRAALEAEGMAGEVSVAFVDEAAIARLNEQYRGVQGPTDVLSFPEASVDEWPAGVFTHRDLGEIVICPGVVFRYAGEEARDPGLQLGWTLIHGALHLAGYDHEADRGEMREREQRLLQELAGLVEPLDRAFGPDVTGAG